VKAGTTISMQQPSNKNASRSPESDRVVVIMAKAPRPGTVKTRLARHLPVPAVVELYRCLLDDTMTLVRSLEDLRSVIMCPASDVEELSRLAGNGIQVVGQAGAGLAAALTSVFERFAAGGRSRVVAFNSDSPHLPPSLLLTAFDELASCDLVVGPTHDGGYYLVGATTSHPELFSGDSMGTKNALEALLAKARGSGLSVRLTGAFYDIDVAADLRRLASELELAPARAPRTSDWLAKWERVLKNSQAAGAEPEL
jgi:rSAM/selenodomain-associated transferase 1